MDPYEAHTDADTHLTPAPQCLARASTVIECEHCALCCPAMCQHGACLVSPCCLMRGLPSLLSQLGMQ